MTPQRLGRSRRPRAVAIVGIAGLLLSAGLSGCGLSGDKTETKSAPTELWFGVEQPPDPLDPATLSDNRSIELGQNVFQGLAGIDNDGNVVPGLTTWETEDAQHYVFTINGEPKFQNGDPVTADDLAFSINRVLDPEIASPYTFFLSQIEGADDVTAGKADTASGIEVVDDKTLNINLTEPAAYFPALASRWPYWAVDQKQVEATGSGWASSGNTAGSGPYRLVESSADTTFKFTASEAAPEDLAIKNVTVTVVPDPASRLARYKAGEFDAIFGLSAATLAQVEADPDLREELHTASQLRTAWLSMDNSKAPFDDIRVRQAFNYAIDREAIVDRSLGGLGEAASTFLPPGLAGVTQPSSPQLFYSHDAAAAQQLMEEAGYAGGKGFPKLPIVLGDRAVDQSVAQQLQSDLKKVLGVEVTIKSMPQNAFNELVNNPKTTPELMMYSFGLDYPDPQEMLEFFGTSDGFVNFAKYSDAKFDADVDRGNTVTDPAERQAAYSAAQDRFLEAAAIAPLYHPTTAWMTKPEVSGVGVSPLYMLPWDQASKSK